MNIHRLKMMKQIYDCKEGNSIMKSFFLLTFLVALLCDGAWAQTPASTIYNAKLVNNEKRDFKNFYDRLRIGYFGVPTTPHFYDMARNRWNNAAVSPQWGKEAEGRGKNEDTVPVNIWNQISFNYNFGAKLNFVLNPRFSLNLANAKDNAPETSLVAMEDWLVGFQGVVFSTEDKKLNVWIRPGIRLPTSRGSRLVNSEFGRLTYQPELAYNPTYDFNKKWQLGIFGQFRSWIYDDRYNFSRFRFYTAPFVQYTLNDTTRISVYFQSMIENNKRHPDIGLRKKPVYKNYYQDVMIGFNKDITPKLNLFPYLGIFIEDKPFHNGPAKRDFHEIAINSKAFYVGAWISYQIK